MVRLLTDLLVESCCIALALCLGSVITGKLAAAGESPETSLYHVVEFEFRGPDIAPREAPARDVELFTAFRHQSGDTVRVAGFWDGDGRGGSRGNVFKVRFCPSKPGQWTIIDTKSNRPELAGQRVGDTLTCTPSAHHGFWVAEGRWYARSDGSHQYIVGNTHYSFLSRQNDRGPVATNPVQDVRTNAQYFKKLRFALVGCSYANPQHKPFLDDAGQGTDDGRFAWRPNPQWFHERVDPVVREAYAHDLICDLILCGPDTREARSTLVGDNQAWLRYVAARYGAFPNVWFCLCNEWNIKRPAYTADQMRAAGDYLQQNLPWRNPISVHSDTGLWDTALNGDWNDHTIIQWKLKKLPEAADTVVQNMQRGGGKPVVNDENAYQGAGDEFSLEDTIEGCLGTFLGGGYATTGEKYGSKVGQYFWGSFDPNKHSASKPLGVLRTYVDQHVAFWRMKAVLPSQTPFRDMPADFRVLADEGHEYVVGSNREARVQIELPAGKWQRTQVDLLSERELPATTVSGRFELQTPASRAVLTHFKRVD